MGELAYLRQGLESFSIRPYRMKRLWDWAKRMSTDRTDPTPDENVIAVLAAQGIAWPEKPRNIYRVQKLYASLAKYAPENSPCIVLDDHLRHGLALARTCFARPGNVDKLHCLPMTPETINLITKNMKASAGLTNYGCSKEASRIRALERGYQILGRYKLPEPCLAFARTQFDDKTRLVWGYPYSMTLIEGLIAYPFIQKMKRMKTPLAFAMTSGQLGTSLVVASYHKDWAYSIDMSSYDSSISAKLIHQAFKIIKTWFDMDEIEPETGVTVGFIFDVIENYFIHTPIVMPDMRLFIGKKHGVPSGSYFTQMIDSIVNVIIAGAISHRFSLHVDKQDIFVLGDDLLIWSNRAMDLDTMARYASNAFGVKMHGSEKSARYRFDEPIHYLGRDWTNGFPNIPIDEIIARMVWPERYRKRSKDKRVRDYEIRLFILQYAAVYRDAWYIADKLLGSDIWYAKGTNYVERGTYFDQDIPVKSLDPDHLSGLMRYKLLYESDNAKCPVTTTPLLYWR